MIPACAPLILVVGMHRSGTSLLGSLLPELGIPMPGPLIEGDPHNPEGYYERADITDLQENLLIELGHWWPSQQGVLDLPPDWLDRPPTLEAARRLRELLAGEIQRQPGPWAIKDPRTSLLLPLWRQLAAEVGLPLQLVLCVRDPAEVAASLLRRDREAAGMTAWRAQQLWWRHTTQVLLDGRGLPLHLVHYDGWFGAASEAASQLRRLTRFCLQREPAPGQERRALDRIRPEHRRSIADPRRLLPIHPRIRSLAEQLRAFAAGSLERGGLEQELSNSPQPLSLPLSHWRHGTPPPTAAPLDPGEHPWGAAALARHGGHHGRARHQLSHWRVQGTLSAADLAQIALAEAAAFPLLVDPPSLPAVDGRSTEILCLGEPGGGWPLHAWLQHLPLPLEPQRCTLQPGDGAQSSEASGEPPLTLALHGQAIARSAEQRRLERLATLAAVFDRDPVRVDQLRRLGVRAHHLTTGQPNAWLRQPQDLEAIAARLGLPDPSALGPSMADGAAGDPLIVALGSGGPDWERHLGPPCWCLPGFDGLELENGDDERLLAAWLDRCQAAGLQLLRFSPGEKELLGDGYGALRPPETDRPGWMPAQFFQPPLALEAVAEELAWRSAGCPAPPPCSTPAPAADRLWQRQVGAVRAAVAISLHDYADRIETALESVRAQTLPELELVVVDDASNDASAQVALRWLERHGDRFPSARLLCHQANGGLAAARNTAFAALEAPWCFVLDADNELFPEAVERCLAVAETAPATAAVVHPLVDVTGPDSGSAKDDPSPLLSPWSWQKPRFAYSNYVDAMALVRVDAWRQVGGYVHIPGGWEDYDFWCQLIDAGFHGVLCPQRLARYHRHGASMLATATHRHVRRISRLLQGRHPWLRLPMAEPGV
jgi:GT2 family glycosyltransferase